MVEQVAVAALVETAFLVEEVDVLLQHFALREVRLEVGDDAFFLLRERVGIFGVDRRKVGALQRIASLAEHDVGGVVVDLVEEAAALHLEVGIPRDQLAFELQHDHRDRLLRGADGVGVRIDARREERQGTQADAVAALQDVGVVVAQAVPHDARNADLASRCRAHPHDVVVAPLDIDVVIVEEHVEDRVGTATAVEEIADDVQAVDGEPLDEHAERLDEARAAVDLHDRREEAAMVLRLRRVLLGARVKKLDDDGLVSLGDEAAHLARRILVAHELRQFQKPREILPIPGGRVLALGVHALDLLLRVVDERAELPLLLVRHAVGEDILDLLADDPRAVVQYMEKRFILAMQIAHEMLDALGQAELRLQGDELFVDGLKRRILLSEQPQELVLLLRALFHRDLLQYDLFSYPVEFPRQGVTFLLAFGGERINLSDKCRALP